MAIKALQSSSARAFVHGMLDGGIESTSDSIPVLSLFESFYKHDENLIIIKRLKQ